MENNNEHNIKKGHFDAFVHAVGSEIEQAQVRLITAANAQMLFHYWKMGNYILYHQHLHGWGGIFKTLLMKSLSSIADNLRRSLLRKYNLQIINL